MHISKKKNKNILETISKEDTIQLIKICYKDKLLYGYVKWKQFDTKQFSQKQSVNNFKNIWRQLNKNFENASEEFAEIIEQVEKEVQEINKNKKIIKENNGIKLNSINSIKSRTSISNISLLRNFSTVNSSFFNYSSKYYSPLNRSSNNDLNSSFLKYNKGTETRSSIVNYNSKRTNHTSFETLHSKPSIRNYGSTNKTPSASIHNYNSKTLKKNESGIKKVDYIKRNISDIKKQSELLDYYFVIISLIHQDKKYTLLKKVHELYEVKILKYSTNQHVKYNDYILHCIRRIHELSVTNSITHNKSFSKIVPFTNTSTFSMDTHDSKIYDTKNICIIETKEKNYQFNRSSINFTLFYQTFKNNINLNNNKVASFIMPLPKKPRFLTFKDNSFYIFDKIVHPGKDLEEEVHNYVHIIYKFFISFMFWSFYLKYQGIEKTKQLFNKELEDLYKLFMENTKSQDTTQESKTSYNHPCILSKKRKLQRITNLCVYVIKLYLKRGKHIDDAYLHVLRIFNMTLHPKHKKKILHSYLRNISILSNLIFKLKKHKRSNQKRKMKKMKKSKK